MGYFGEGQDIQFDGPVFLEEGRSKESVLGEL
jgi:hypothetical protein